MATSSQSEIAVILIILAVVYLTMSTESMKHDVFVTPVYTMFMLDTCDTISEIFHCPFRCSSVPADWQTRGWWKRAFRFRGKLACKPTFRFIFRLQQLGSVFSCVNTVHYALNKTAFGVLQCALEDFFTITIRCKLFFESRTALTWDALIHFVFNKKIFFLVTV